MSGGGGGGGGGGGARGGSAAVATVRLRMHGSRPSARRAAKATADSPTRPADVRADADVCTVAAVIDVSSSRTGVPRPQRRARLLRQQAAEAAREPAAGGGGGGGGAGDDGAGGGSSAPPAITAVPRAPSLRLGLAELSLDSVDRCLPAADGRTIAAQSGREATGAARQSDGEAVRPGQQRSGDTAYIRAWLAEGRA
jgi:hypothetical protein